MRLKAFENDDHPRTSAGPYRCRMRKSMAKSIHPIHLCSVLLKWVVGNLFLVSYLCLATRRGHKTRSPCCRYSKRSGNHSLTALRGSETLSEELCAIDTIAVTSHDYNILLALIYHR